MNSMTNSQATDVPKYVPERCFQGLQPHETLIATGVGYDIENAKIEGKMVYYHSLCYHGMSPGPYFGAPYVMDRYYQEIHKGSKIIQIDHDLSMLQLCGTPYMQNLYFVNRIATA